MIIIRKHTRKDLSYRVKWLNNSKANKFLGDRLGEKTTLKKEEKWFDDYEKNKNKKFFTICDDKKSIGFMGLSYIDKFNKNADLFIVIGDDNYRGKGIGRKAMLWLVNYGFKKLSLHKIRLQVYKENIGAYKLYKKLGFKIEGVMKDESYSKGKFYDLVIMAKFDKDVKK